MEAFCLDIRYYIVNFLRLSNGYLFVFIVRCSCAYSTMRIQINEEMMGFYDLEYLCVIHGNLLRFVASSGRE